jgi:hypothetical protein
MPLKTRVLASDRHINVERLNKSMGYQHSPPDKWISNGNTYGNNPLKKPAQIRSNAKRPQAIITMNYNISMDSTISSSITICIVYFRRIFNQLFLSEQTTRS